MNATNARIMRGSVVARGGAQAVVWAVNSSRLTVLPLIPVAGAGFRNDVPVRSWADLAAIGCGGIGLAVRPAGARQVAPAGWLRIGGMTASLFARVADACRREVAENSARVRWERPRASTQDRNSHDSRPLPQNFPATAGGFSRNAIADANR